MSTVKVVPFKDGSLQMESKKNALKAFFRVEQVSTSISNGQINKERRTATVQGLKSQIAEMNIFAGKELTGKIVVTESLTPSFDGQEPKIAGETGVVCTLGGAPIYRNTSFGTDLSKADTLIAHDNVAEIKAAQAAMKAKAEFKG